MARLMRFGLGEVCAPICAATTSAAITMVSNFITRLSPVWTNTAADRRLSPQRAYCIGYGVQTEEGGSQTAVWSRHKSKSYAPGTR